MPKRTSALAQLAFVAADLSTQGKEEASKEKYDTAILEEKQAMKQDPKVSCPT